MQEGAAGVEEEDLREVNNFLVILVDNLVKPLVFPEVVKVGILPDLVELLKPRPQGSLQGIQTCVYLHTMYSKSDGLSGTGGAASRLSPTSSILSIIIMIVTTGVPATARYLLGMCLVLSSPSANMLLPF